MAMRQGHYWKLLRVQNFGLSNQASAAEGEILLIQLGQLSFRFQLLIHPLTDCAIGTVSTDNDIALKGLLVGKMDGDLVVLFGGVQNTMAEMDLVGWDLF